MNLLEYIARRETKNPDEKIYRIIGKVYNPKTGRYRAARDYEKKDDNETKVEEFLCYKNGHIVVSGFHDDLKKNINSLKFNENPRNSIKTLKLTPQEKKVIKAYTGGSDVCPSVNAYLRGHKEGTKADIKNSEILEGVFEKVSSDSPALLFRKFQYTDLGEQTNSGDVFEDKGFASTSALFNVVKDFKSVVFNGLTFERNPYVNVIITPEGSKALSIGDFSIYKSEKEVLLKNGTRFQILSKDDKNKIILTQVINSDSDIIPSKYLKNSTGQKYLNSKDHEKFLEKMKDGTKFAVLDMRGSSKPSNYFMTPNMTLEPNPEYDEEVSKKYHEIKERYEALDQEILERFKYTKEKNPDYDKEISEKSKELNEKTKKLSDDFLKIRKKLNLAYGTPEYDELAQEDHFKEELFQDANIISMEFDKVNRDKINEFIKKDVPYNSYNSNSEYWKLKRERDILLDDKWSYESDEELSKKLNKYKPKSVEPKELKISPKYQRTIEVSKKFSDNNDGICILEVMKKDGKFILRETISGDVINERTLENTKENIKHLTNFIDDNYYGPVTVF